MKKQIKAVIRSSQNLPDNILAKVAPDWHYQRRKQGWQEKWAQPGFNPGWKITDIPEKLQEAVGTGWFSERAALLDIGCGDGEITHWLAQQGYDALGIDYSSPAVEKAKKTYTSDSLKLSYQAIDVTRMPAPERRFDALFDRGCFHIIPEKFAAAYSDGVASWSNPGARFLLLATTSIGTSADKGREWWINHVKQTFQGNFSIEKIEEIHFIFNAKSGAKKPMPAIAVWMICR